MPKKVNFANFCGQTVLPDRPLLIGQKLLENAKIQSIKLQTWLASLAILNDTFLVIFKYCGDGFSLFLVYVASPNPPFDFRRTFFPFPLSSWIQKSTAEHNSCKDYSSEANREPKSSAWGTNEVDHSPFWMDPVVTIALPPPFCSSKLLNFLSLLA